MSLLDNVSTVCCVYVARVQRTYRIVAVATINFALSFVRLLIEGGSYSRAATITARQYRVCARMRNNCVRTYVYERACPPYDIAL